MKALNVVRLTLTGVICAGLLTACYDPNGFKAKRSFSEAEWQKYYEQQAKQGKPQKPQQPMHSNLKADADDLAKQNQAANKGDQGAQSKTTAEANVPENNAWVKQTETLLQSKIAGADKVVSGITITLSGKTGALNLGLDAIVVIDPQTTLMVNGATQTPLAFAASDKLVQTIPLEVKNLDGTPAADNMSANISLKAACLDEDCSQVLVRLNVAASGGEADTVYLATPNDKNIYSITESNLPNLVDFQTAQNQLGTKAKAADSKDGSLKVKVEDTDKDKADANTEPNDDQDSKSLEPLKLLDLKGKDAASNVDKSNDGKVTSTPHGDKGQVAGESAQAKDAVKKDAKADLKAQIAKTPSTEVKTLPAGQTVKTTAPSEVKSVGPEAYQDSKPLQPLKLLDLGKSKVAVAPTQKTAASPAANNYQDSKPLEPLKLLDIGKGNAAAPAQKANGYGYQDSKPLEPLKLLDVGQKTAPAAEPAPAGAAPAQKQTNNADQKKAMDILAANVGTRQIMQKDGSTKLIKADGTVVIINADGTIRSTTAAPKANEAQADLLK